MCYLANNEIKAISSLLNDKWVEDHTLLMVVFRQCKMMRVGFGWEVNGNNPERGGSGLHRSLLFVDMINNQAVHL